MKEQLSSTRFAAIYIKWLRATALVTHGCNFPVASSKRAAPEQPGRWRGPPNPTLHPMWPRLGPQLFSPHPASALSCPACSTASGCWPRSAPAGTGGCSFAGCSAPACALSPRRPASLPPAGCQTQGSPLCTARNEPGGRAKTEGQAQVVRNYTTQGKRRTRLGYCCTALPRSVSASPPCRMRS